MTDSPAPPLSFALSPDRARVVVAPASAAPFELSAEGVEALVRALVAGRAGMAPALRHDDPAVLGRVSTHPGMRLRLEPEGDGSGDLLLGVFHPGLGWIGIEVKPEVSRELLRVIAGAIGPGEAGASDPLPSLRYD